MWNTAHVRKGASDMLLILGLDGVMDKFAVANILHYNGHVFSSWDVYVLRAVFKFEVEGQWMKWHQN